MRADKVNQFKRCLKFSEINRITILSGSDTTSRIIFFLCIHENQAVNIFVAKLVNIEVVLQRLINQETVVLFIIVLRVRVRWVPQ